MLNPASPTTCSLEHRRLVVCVGGTEIRAQSFAYRCLARLGLSGAVGGAVGATCWSFRCWVWAIRTVGAGGAVLAGLYAGCGSWLAVTAADGRCSRYFALAPAAAGSVLCTPYGTG